uniref:Multidrug and toxic compound extrusion protein n=1 Tax=Kalanchoe fedtschenkoi TaxID=63787 RepID=A0A7N0VLM9_KALFE
MDERLLAPESRPEAGLWRKTWEESKKMWRVAFPAIVCRVTTFGVMVVTQAFMGHISELDLAAYALIQIISVRFSNGVLLGMSSATETLCGQAFGAKQYHMLGIYLQRSWIINLATATILVPFYAFATPIYRLLGQDEAIAKRAGVISLWFIPFLYQNCLNMTIQKCLQAQMRNRIVGWLSLASFVGHVFLSWLFVSELGWGVSGAMGALLLSSWLTVVGQFVYLLGGWCPDTWTGFSMAAFTDLWPVVKLSVSSGVMLCLELWYTAVLVLIAGYMTDAETAISAFSICLNIIGWVQMVSIGFLGASCVRVANELGRGDAEAVKFSIKVILSTGASIGVVFFILALVFGRKIGYLFTSDEAIAKAVSSLSIFLAFSILLNSFQPILSGVAVGAGRQTIVAYINICSYYVVGVPLGVILAYVAHLEIKVISPETHHFYFLPALKV